jgi:hypothetical protein
VIPAQEHIKAKEGRRVKQHGDGFTGPPTMHNDLPAPFRMEATDGAKHAFCGATLSKGIELFDDIDRFGSRINHPVDQFLFFAGFAKLFLFRGKLGRVIALKLE